MSGNGDYGVVRDEVLVDARERARALAAQGLPVHEIEQRLDRDLTATERELLWDIARQEVAAARMNLNAPASPPPTVAGRWEEARRWTRTRLRRARRGSVPVVVSVALAGALTGLLIGWVVAGGGEQGAKSSGAQTDRPHRPRAEAHGKTHARGGRSSPAASTQQSTPTTPPAAPTSTEGGAGQTSQPVSANAASLNDQGFQLMSEGRYHDAIPLLRRAVSSAPESGDMTYAYALYNLGRSLRLAGRPGEAIPLLERRLRIANQRATVARELEAARRGVGTGGSR